MIQKERFQRTPVGYIFARRFVTVASSPPVSPLKIIATFALFYAVGIWNDFFHALLYMNDSAKWPLQMVLRQVTILSDLTGTTNDMMENTVPPEQSIKLAVIVIATLPILAVYPFLQKHFAKGILIGSVKG